MMEQLVFLDPPKGLMACGCGKATGLAQNWNEVNKVLGEFDSKMITANPPPLYCTYCMRYCREVIPGILTLLVVNEDTLVTAAEWRTRFAAKGSQVTKAFSYVRDVIQYQDKTPVNPQLLRSFRRIICSEDREEK